MATREEYYCDYAAATPLDPVVRAAMEPYLGRAFGNPSSLHTFGQEASAAVFRARRTIAGALETHHAEIVFTGSATEANNLALRGAVKGTRNPPPRIIVSAIEHESALETARDLEKDGVEVVYLPVSRDGIVNLDRLAATLNDRTVLVSVMYANNEVGAIQPIAKIAKIIRNFRMERAKNNTHVPSSYWLVARGSLPLFHTDAVQAFQYLDCRVDTLGVDMMTLSSHKIYGPKGIGALYVKHEIRNKGQGTQDGNSMSHVSCPMSPIITGGGQESGLRSGTENVPAIVGFAKAVEIAGRLREREASRVSELRDRLLRALRRGVPALRVNGSLRHRLPNNLNVFLPGRKAGELIMRLDLKGFAIAAGSACAARSPEPSRVLRAMGHSNARARESVRITLGRATTARAVDSLARAILK